MCASTALAVLRAISWIFIGASLSACAAVESSLEPRSYAINTGWNGYRNNSILLNIVRAGQGEPLNFVALSGYTATGDLNAGASTQLVFAPSAGSPTATYGPFNTSAKLGNTFNVAELDTGEFYTAMMTPVEPKELHWLLRQGIPREIVFHLVLDSIRLTLPNGDTYDFRNDPTDDRWIESSGAIKNPSPICQELDMPRFPGIKETSFYQPPFGTEPNPYASDIWTGPHAEDCRYHKFRYLVRMALRYGLTTEIIQVTNQGASAGRKDEPKMTDKKEEPKTTDKKEGPKTTDKTQFCYDAAIAREFGTGYVKDSASACGSKQSRPKHENFQFAGVRSRNTVIRDVVPILRSPISVFRYLGRILATGTNDRVVMITTRDERTQDNQLLTVGGPGHGCFAQVTHFGESYCVPAEGAQNTKSAFSLLASLVALHTKRSDFPPAPALLITP